MIPPQRSGRTRTRTLQTGPASGTAAGHRPAEECIERRWYCSFAGNVTYPKAGDLQQAARELPAELLLVETDSPFLSPQVLRSKRNEPAYVVHTAHQLAGLRGLSYEELERIVEQNAARVLGW